MEEEAQWYTIHHVVKPHLDKAGIDVATMPLDWLFGTDDLKNYTYVFPFESSCDRVKMIVQSQKTWLVSIWIAVLYVAFITIGRKVMSKREPFELRIPLALWNIAMALFSTLGFIRLRHELFRVLGIHGFLYSICTRSYGRDPVAAFWISAFVKSKFFELIDTVFIVLRKKPLPFMHWYHHLTVLLFAWHSAKEISATGRWYAWMNYGAHSLMYTYYALHTLNFRPPRWIQMVVTVLQICQQAMGIFISCVVWKAKTSWDPTCHQSWANLMFAGTIYFSFFLLFARFFMRMYVLPRYNKRYAPSFPDGKSTIPDYPLQNGFAKGGETKKFI